MVLVGISLAAVENGMVSDAVLDVSDEVGQNRVLGGLAAVRQIALAERMDSGDRRWQKRQSIAVQETKKPAQLRRASLGFLRERRYANLGHLLPMFHIERAVKPGVSALPLR